VPASHEMGARDRSVSPDVPPSNASRGVQQCTRLPQPVAAPRRADGREGPRPLTLRDGVVGRRVADLQHVLNQPRGDDWTARQATDQRTGGRTGSGRDGLPPRCLEGGDPLTEIARGRVAIAGFRARPVPGHMSRLPSAPASGRQPPFPGQKSRLPTLRHSRGRSFARCRPQRHLAGSRERPRSRSGPWAAADHAERDGTLRKVAVGVICQGRRAGADAEQTRRHGPSWQPAATRSPRSGPSTTLRSNRGRPCG